jgi:sporulation protein YlmC with PRC-barrel domain
MIDATLNLLASPAFPPHKSFHSSGGHEMLTKSLATALLGTVLIAAPAYAQAPAPGGATSQSAAGNWVQQMKPGLWRASKLHDINVYNNNNEKIGEIDDILLDQSGKADVVVIEVGGFLGMGKHTVALPYNQVKFVDEPRDSARAAGTTTSGNTTGTGPGTPAAAVPGGDPARGDRPAAGTGGMTDNRAAANRDNSARDRGYPDHAVLNMTKDQLKAAPEFKWSASR